MLTRFRDAAPRVQPMTTARREELFRRWVGTPDERSVYRTTTYAAYCAAFDRWVEAHYPREYPRLALWRKLSDWDPSTEAKS